MSSLKHNKKIFKCKSEAVISKQKSEKAETP